MAKVTAKAMSPLLRTATTTRTDFWSDSCGVAELTYALAHGAVGATIDPTIALSILRKEPPRWREVIARMIDDRPDADEETIAWKVIEDLGLRGAELLLPVFEREQGSKGRLSMQTNPIDFRSTDRLIEHAVHFATLAPNIQVKIPATAAGIAAIEEVTHRGVSINATVGSSLSQAVAVAEAVERGLIRRTCRGIDVSAMAPVCTIMLGRLDDWLRLVARRDGIAITPGHIDWAGIAVLKNAYRLFKARGYRTRLLAAAYRSHLHWSELIGGDLILTIPHDWQVLLNNSEMEVKERIGDPVDSAIVGELYRAFPDFQRAYDEDGLLPEDFIHFGATVSTLRVFIEHYREMLGVVRDVMLPPPEF